MLLSLFQKSESQNRKQSLDTTVQVYAKSWVFEGTTEDEFHHTDDSSSISICSTSPAHANSSNTNHKSKHNQGRRISRTSDATSERFNPQMSSFSRCATPVPHSGQATPTNGPTFLDYLEPSTFGVSLGNGQLIQPKPNRLTVDYVASPAPSPTIFKITPKVPTAPANNNGPSSISSQQDDSQYASLLAELEQSLMDKKLQANKDQPSPDNSSLTPSTDKYCSSKSSSKDLEFSKELEAALQLIQELETPSEGPLDQVPAGTKFARSESEKTLSAAVSLPSPESVPFSLTSPADTAQTPQNGKHAKRNVITIEPNSQSTSGYSSPNSFSSNAQSTNGKESIFSKPPPPPPPPKGKHTPAPAAVSAVSAEQIFTGDQSNIVRIYIEPGGRCTSNNLLTKGHILSASNLIESSDRKPIDSLNKSFLLFKKRSKLMPQPDFQNRIFKSECLAYLSDEELVARHRCNRDVIRVRAPNSCPFVDGY